MPRVPRLLLSQSYYHVMMRGNNRQVTFRETDDYIYYLSLMERFKSELPFNLYHYCLMPNHVHFMIKTKKAHHFATYMKKLNLAYYHYVKKRYGLVGHLWQGRYKSQAVGKDEYFIQCGKYIELNPIRAGLVVSPEQYQYSSYRYYSLGEPDFLVSDDPFYQTIGLTISERQKHYQTMLIQDSVQTSYRDKVWGSDTQRYSEEKKIRYHMVNKNSPKL